MAQVLDGSEPSPTRALLKTSAPIALAMLSTFLFQVVDTFFVGMLGAAELAALGFSSTVYLLVIALFMGAAVAVSTLVGHALGRGERSEAQATTNLSLLSGIVLAVVVCTLGALSIEPLFGALGASDELLPLIARYLNIIYLGMPLLIIGLVADSAMRADGDAATPSVIMGAAGVINAVLDYVLVFGMGPVPKMELAGAAWATVASWLMVAAVSVFFLVKKRLVSARVRGAGRILRELARLSSPTILTQILLPVTAFYVTFLAADQGEHVVAGYAVALRLESLFLVGVSAVAVAVVPYVARSQGAQNRGDIDGAIAFSGKTAVYWGIALVIVFVAFATPLASIFSDEKLVVETIELYFYCVCLSYVAYGLTILTAALFNGAMLPQIAFRVLVGKTLFTLICAGVGSVFGTVGLFVGLAVSNAASFLYATRLFRAYQEELGGTGERVNVLREYGKDMERMRRFASPWASS